MHSVSNARNAIPSHRFSFNGKHVIIVAREVVQSIMKYSERCHVTHVEVSSETQLLRTGNGLLELHVRQRIVLILTARDIYHY